MSQKSALILTILVAEALCQTYNNSQIYFPDDAPFVKRRPASQSFAAAGFAAPAPSQILSDNRVNSNYETYVEQIIARGISKLTLAINNAYQSAENYNNVVFAPLNIAGALALVLLGSNGKTFEQLTSVLGLTTGVEIENNSLQVHEQLGRTIKKIESSAGVVIGQQVSFADAVFVQNNYPIRTLYKETAEKLYESEVFNVDFHSNPEKAKQQINAWVSQRTQGKIRDVINDIPSDTKVVIASAMYFKAQWENPFFDESTARRDFFTNGRKHKATSQVDMMANAGEFPYYKDNILQAEILGFPYRGNASVMYVVMPFNSDQQKLKDFESRITEADLNNLASKMVLTNSQILFPKMKIESTIHLKPVLQKLGVTSLFNQNEANLGLISPGAGSIPTKTNSEINPIAPFYGNPNDVLIFSRVGETVNCSSIFDTKSNVTTCEDTVAGPKGNQQVTYKKFGSKVGRKITREVAEGYDTIDSLRKLINNQSIDNNYQNPGLFAEEVIHKVYMDITETGTEAAATTLVTLYRTFRGITFRVDVPFLFFIRHEETKTIMFWGSVYSPTPNYQKV